jgi:hypothetical protein
MFVMHSTSVYVEARGLIAGGTPDSDVARLLHVPVQTVRTWRRRESPRHERRALAAPIWRPQHESTYAYLLGLYLGDGHITRAREYGAFLRLSLDRQYEGIIAEATAAIASMLPDLSVRRYRFDPEKDAIVLHASHPAWPFVFPQHGPGAKHNRPIALLDWQRAITHRYPAPFLRGLIHSDGCRTINRFSTLLPSGRTARYEYVRYFFSNLSGDIRALFCEHCDLIGIRWTQSNPRNISVSYRHSVAELEKIVGPKS